MCGLVGFVAVGSPRREDIVHVRTQVETLIHRGPDDNGIWADTDSRVVLGHSRLSIQDLSRDGHQPMISHSGRYVVVYNGEIYNFKKIKEEIKESGCNSFIRGNSDTEILLLAIETWGFEKTLSKIIGMFSIVLWDKKYKQIFLARDRFGEKPLYYCLVNGVFMFASELKALRCHPFFTKEIDRNILSVFFRKKYVPAPNTIYKNVYKVPAGSYLTLSLGNDTAIEMSLPLPRPYWSLDKIIQDAKMNQFNGSDAEAIDSLDSLISESINGQMIADVPIGAFLSGGFDSSVIATLMQKKSMSKINTFTIGFNETAYNEANHAKEIADFLGTNHTELYVTAEESMSVIDYLPSMYDEPFSDASQIPTALLCKFARKNVTVALSGDGGDELFGGYERHILAGSIEKFNNQFPFLIRNLIAKGIKLFSTQYWDSLFSLLNNIIPKKLHYNHPGYKIYKLATVMQARNEEHLYKLLTSSWSDSDSLVIDGFEDNVVSSKLSDLSFQADIREKMMYMDSVEYLADDILVKMDRASMSSSLETRVPLLDHRICEFAWRLPLEMKIRGDQGKWILRQVLYKYVPKKLVERPKMGFNVPIGDWLRGPLRDWAEDLLDESKIKREGYLNPRLVRIKWNEHLSGKKDLQYCLWDVLMFQSWLEGQK